MREREQSHRPSASRGGVVVVGSSESECSSGDPERVLERRVVLLEWMVKWIEGMMGPGGCPGPAGAPESTASVRLFLTDFLVILKSQF